MMAMYLMNVVHVMDQDLIQVITVMETVFLEKYGYRWMFGVVMLLLGHLPIQMVTLHSLAIWDKHLGQETLFVV